MATKTQSLVHIKWLCKYHIVFTPKYRRKVIYNQYRNSLLKEIVSYKDKAKKRQVVVLDSSQSLSDKEKKLYQKLIDRVDKRLPTYVDVNREPKWLQVLKNITGNDKSLI
uniref:transposase n=1 Tax=uncultured Veillonella sp. TaxID=159268 RepID=UPI00344EFA4F